ncbi:hypothetical protein BDQ17DRAFT_1433187 [Cyathus striatus]|nr:hypothetical protein BDQ17DRAFT_1433187 [Cyathus striatus]
MSPKPKPDSTSASTSKPTNTTHKGVVEKVADASSSRTPVPSATANVSAETDAAVKVADGAKDASSLGTPASTATHDQVANVSATTAAALKVADGTTDASSLGTPVSTATRDQVVNVSAATATASKVAADAKDASSALAPPALLDQTVNDPADNAVPPMATIDSQGSSSSILEDLKKKLLYIETGKARLLKKSLAMEVARQEGERQIEYKKQCMVREMQDMEKKHQEQREAEEKVRAALEKYMQGELQKRKELHLRRDAQLSVSSQQMEKEKRELEMDNGLFLRTLSQTVNLVGDQMRYDDTKKMVSVDSIKEVSTTTMQDFVDFVATAVKMKRTGMEDEEQMLKEHERDQQDKELKTEKKEKKKRRGVEKEVEKAVEEELKKKREEMMQKLEELENERKGRMQKQQEELEKEHKERVRKQQEELEKERKERMRKQQEELEKEHKERMRKQQEELEKERKERMRKQQEELEKEHKEGMRKQQEELEKERKERVQAMVQERMQEWAQERMQTVRSDHAQELQELQNRHKEVMAKLFDDNWEKLMRDLGLREAEELSTNDQNVEEASNVDGTLAPGDQSRSLGNPEAGESARDAPKPEGQSDEG